MAQYRHVNEYAGKCFENARLYPKLRRTMALLKSAKVEEEHSSYLDRLGNGGMSSCV